MGALGKMLPAFRWGVAGRLGSGRQYWSWISLDDAVGALRHALLDRFSHGTCERGGSHIRLRIGSSPRPWGGCSTRPTWIPVPDALIRLAIGEMADELLLSSARVVPRRLLETGYVFRHDDLEDALRHMLGRVT